MRFPYRRYVVQGTIPNSHVLAFRPMITDLSGPVPIDGIGGLTFARFGTVDLEIGQGAASYRWSAYVGFYSHRVPVFGLKGFLRCFKATFDGRRHYLDLSPNGTAPLPTFLAA